MNIGFSGTRKGLTLQQKNSLQNEFKKLKDNSIIFHHGDCKGADEEACYLLIEKNLINGIVTHPPIKTTLRAFISNNNIRALSTNINVDIRMEEDYLIRNKNIIEESDIIFICPKTETEELRSGTWSTFRKAQKLNKQIKIIYPSGAVEEWPDVELLNRVKKKLNNGKIKKHQTKNS